MLVSLADMKTYLGLSSNTYDAFLTEQLQLTSDAVEAYCGRKFEAATYTQTFYRDDQYAPIKNLTLFHYPLNSITSVEEDAIAITEYRVSKPTSVLVNTDGWFNTGKVLEVVYNAGYSVIPSILQSVVKSVVEERYNKKVSGVALNFGSDVQRVSIPGTISIDFDYSLSANDRKTSYGMILGNYINMLDGYRSERVITGTGKITYVD